MNRAVRLSEEIQRGLQEALPHLRKTVLRKLPLAVAAMLEARTPNTQELVLSLPLETERADMREQWLRRLLKNPRVDRGEILAPFARSVLRQASEGGQTLQLLMDQTDLGDKVAILMLSVRVGHRALPLAWTVEAGAANIGWEGQRTLLEQVKAWLPAGVAVMLLADRFYPSANLFSWLQGEGWCYRLRLKGNLSVDIGRADIHTTAELAAGVTARFEANARLFAAGIPTSIGILHETGHPEPWIIAMDCRPTRAAVRDYGARWVIEPQFSDFKSRGFQREDTHLRDPRRVSCMILIMALAMYWCVQAGREDARNNPTPTEKKPANTPGPTIPQSAKRLAVSLHGSSGGCVYC